MPNGELERDVPGRKVPRFCSCPADPWILRYGRFAVPRAAACDVEHERYHHRDLEHADQIDVEAEFADAVRTLALLRPGRRPVERAWLVRRYQRLHDLRECPEHPPEPDADAVRDSLGGTVPAMSEGGPKVRVVVVEVE